ncbi:hypothetical protein AOL_s00054g401 [Orbilia oligospora ATCC 24927]|uniref:Uncharacterized protein n=1 Tax=Arthrobotrys oligospora (strain ATCC 24927 / CBS 115.81 / DSM 1491) TaxID=756982 RepID=G1X6A7_ARTOA|nr:hypothetical protein AOL_s00054g401 [Orbilia oligospora ATCC 24927]EGX51331.1 hypothetical protein AOL_s00054g401 [Orbilia oligospora ATCC 24927]
MVAEGLAVQPSAEETVLALGNNYIIENSAAPGGILEGCEIENLALDYNRELALDNMNREPVLDNTGKNPALAGAVERHSLDSTDRYPALAPVDSVHNSAAEHNALEKMVDHSALDNAAEDFASALDAAPEDPAPDLGAVPESSVSALDTAPVFDTAPENFAPDLGTAAEYSGLDLDGASGYPALDTAAEYSGLALDGASGYPALAFGRDIENNLARDFVIDKTDKGSAFEALDDLRSCVQKAIVDADFDKASR